MGETDLWATLYNSNKVGGPWPTLVTSNRGAGLDKILITGGMGRGDVGRTRHGGEEGGEREMPSVGGGRRTIGEEDGEAGIGTGAPIRVAMTGMQASRDIPREMGGEVTLKGGGRNLKEGEEIPRSGGSLLLSYEFFISSNLIYNSTLLAIYLSLLNFSFASLTGICQTLLSDEYLIASNHNHCQNHNNDQITHNFKNV